jgi:hypothetical protein
MPGRRSDASLGPSSPAANSCAGAISHGQPKQTSARRLSHSAGPAMSSRSRSVGMASSSATLCRSQVALHQGKKWKGRQRKGRRVERAGGTS